VRLLHAGSYGFEYSDEDMSTGAVAIENEYYKAKGTLTPFLLKELICYALQLYTSLKIRMHLCAVSGRVLTTVAH
jgi:hypothetical protein